LVLQRVERLVLDLPTRATAENQVRNVRGINVQLGDPTKSFGHFAIGCEFHVLDERHF
jgi:hypothetical protein